MSTAVISLERWADPPSPAEDELLARARGPVLDIGCGPGRHAAALIERGVLAIGIDIAPPALAMATQRGVPVLARSLFAALPGEGEWGTALLLDGNLGLGGDPAAVLRRVAHLLRPGGTVLLDAQPPGTPMRRAQLRLAGSEVRFGFAYVAIDAVAGLAPAAGLRLREAWTRSGAWYAELVRE